MIEIEVRLHGVLNRYRPREAPGSGAFRLALPDGATAADAIARLGIPRAWARTLAVGDELCGGERVLRPGDRLAVLLPVGGG